MTDPRFTDPRYNDPRSDPVLRRNDSASGTWAWIAGIVVLGLIAFMLVGGWNGDSNNTASDNTPPVTTGSGTMSPPPAAPTR